MALEEVRFEALGSSCHLLGIGLERGRLSWAAAWVLEMHGRFSRFEPDSELSRFNSRAGDWVEVSSELGGLLHAALEGYRLSGGLVHVGVLDSMLAIGYSRPLRHGIPQRAPAGAAAPPPLPEMLQVEDRRARLRAGAGIDLGGIAKGWLADRLAWEASRCFSAVKAQRPAGPGAGHGVEETSMSTTSSTRAQGGRPSAILLRRRSWRRGRSMPRCTPRRH